VVIDQGRIIARGTSDELKEQIGGERLELTIAPQCSLPTALRTIRPHTAGGEIQVDEDHRHITTPLIHGGQQLSGIVHELEAAQVILEEFALRRPTLDDVFLSLTGRNATQHNHNGASQPGRSSK